MTKPKSTYTFGKCTLHTAEGALEVDGTRVELRPKTVEVLVHLLEHAGRPVSVHELLDSVWSGTVVTDDSVRQCIAELRRAIGDDEQQVIRTRRRRGYTIAVPVTSRDETGRSVSGSTVGRPRLRIAAFLVLVAVAFAIWRLMPEQERTDEPNGGDVSAAVAPASRAESTDRPPSIAVLRFADMSPDQDMAYLADGLSEELLNTLTQSPALRVIARTSSFAMSDRPVGEIARTLGVSHIVEGSVREDRGRIRVTAQLIDAATSLHLWSQTYDREPDDVLDFQTEMAGEIANLLSITLDPDRRGGTDNPVAYRYFLQAQYHYALRAGDHRQLAREYYQRAVDEDPRFARAWIGLAASLQALLGDHGAPVHTPAEVERLRALQERAITEALEFGAMLPEAHMRAAGYYLAKGDRQRMSEHIREAIALDPDHWLVLAARIEEHLLSGRTDQAVRLQRELVLRDPLNVVARWNLASFLYLAGRYAEAVQELTSAGELFGSAGAADATVVLLQGRALIADGQPEAALELFGGLDGYRLSLGRALAHLALGDAASAAPLIGQAAGPIEEADALLLAAEVHALRGDPAAAVDHLLRLGTPVCSQIGVPLHAYHSAFLRRLEGDAAWEGWRSSTATALRRCATDIASGLTDGLEPPTARLQRRPLARPPLLRAQK